jgi:hypothetical protein
MNLIAALPQLRQHVPNNLFNLRVSRYQPVSPVGRPRRSGKSRAAPVRSTGPGRQLSPGCDQFAKSGQADGFPAASTSGVAEDQREIPGVRPPRLVGLAACRRPRPRQPDPVAASGPRAPAPTRTTRLPGPVSEVTSDQSSTLNGTVRLNWFGTVCLCNPWAYL